MYWYKKGSGVYLSIDSHLRSSGRMQVFRARTGNATGLGLNSGTIGRVSEAGARDWRLLGDST